MSNKKTKITLSLMALTASTLTSIFLINKAISKLAVSKELLSHRNKKIYHWTFGDISYSVSGTGKPLLLIHDLKKGSSSIEWSELISRLSKTNMVYTIDLLGCGLSDRPNITYTNYLYAQLINDFIHQVIKRKTSVVASGKSAAFVLSACSLNEEIFGELILINPENISYLHKAPAKRTKTAQLILKTPVIGTFIYHFITSKKKIRENFEEKYFYDTEEIPEAVIDCYYEAAHLDGKNAKNMYISLVGRYLNTNIIPVLQDINKSIHILAGHELPDIEGQMKKYQYYNPSIEVEYIDYTKGLPQLEAPDQILELISLYLYTES